MTDSARILIVDDIAQNLNVLSEVLEHAGFEVLAAPSGVIALGILHQTPVDLVLLDVLMPDMDGLATCHGIQQQLRNPPPVIFISANNEVEQLSDAFASGGVDYITKPFRTLEVLARVNNQLKITRLQKQLQTRNEELEHQIASRKQAEAALSVASDTLSLIHQKEAERWGLKAFIGQSEQFQRITQHIRQLQGFSKTNVLILGESGSGKELVARALHFGSDKCQRPFIAINCSAISETLAEADFFGNVKGAFTGATSDRKGYFELADGGTLFLDEVGDLPLPIQAKLLRALEEQQFYPVGGKHLKKVDVRVISATNNDLQQKKQDGTFREDLYFRLAQFTFALPPLRERLQDVPQLAQYFMETFANDMKVPMPKITQAAYEKLKRYRYPGNIRELKNIIERAMILAGGNALDPHHIQIEMETPYIESVSIDAPSLSIKDVKRQLADIALENCAGNVTAAAKLLGVHRSWFYRMDNK